MLKVGAGAVAGAAGDPHKREEEEGEGERKLKRWQKIESIFEERISFRFLKTSLFFFIVKIFFCLRSNFSIEKKFESCNFLFPRNFS